MHIVVLEQRNVGFLGPPINLGGVVDGTREDFATEGDAAAKSAAWSVA